MNQKTVHPYLSTIAICAVTTLHAAPFTMRAVPTVLDSAPQAPIAADFTGDGKLSWYGGGNVISHFPGSGTINLPPIFLPAWSGATVVPMQAAVLDVDKDGDMDIVRINEWNGWSKANTLQVFINDGTGNFSPGYRSDWTSPSYNTGTQHFRFNVADYDLDGDPDLALLNAYEFPNPGFSPTRYDGALRILWNVGGQFNTSTNVQSHHFSDEADMDTADIDGDGDADMICTGYRINDSAGVTHLATRRFINNGNGTFTTLTFEAEMLRPRYEDVNRDGRPDLLCNLATSNPFRLGLWFNQPDSSFQASSDAATSNEFIRFTTADVNENGTPDLVLMENSLVSVKPGLGGSFGASSPIAILPSDGDHVVPADFDADGDTDLMVRLVNGNFTLMENRAPRLHPESTYTQLGLAGVTKVRVADLDGDGFEDLLALTPGTKKIHCFPGQISGTFGAPTFKNTQSAEASDLATGDFNRDGKMDYAYTIPSTGEVRLVLQSGSSFFLWPDTKVADMPGASMIRTGNYMTDNGKPDLMVASSQGDVRWFANSNGGASWLAINMVTGHQPSPVGIHAGSLKVSSRNQGLMIAAQPQGGSFMLKGYDPILGGSWVNFASYTQPQDVPNAGAMTLAEIDGNRGPEVVFVRGDGGLAWWHADSVAANIPNTITAVPDGTIRALATVDWNRDGLDDILCTTTTGLYLYQQTSIPFLSSGWIKHKLGGNSFLGDIAVGDFDRDGRMDTAIGSSATSSVFIYLNRSVAVVGVAPTVAQSSSVQAVAGTIPTVLRMGVKNPGRPAVGTSLADVSIMVTGTSVRFFQAIDNAGQWSMGPAMSKAEVEQAVSSVSLVANGTAVASNSTSSVMADGTLALTQAGVLQIPAGQAIDHNVNLVLKSTASQASYESFYVVHFSGGNAAIYDNGQSGYAGNFHYSTSARVSIVQELTALEQWRQSHFGTTQGTGSGANDADPDGDSVPNIIEYLMGRDPKGTSGVGATSAALGMTMQGNNSPLIADLRLLASYDPKIRITIEHSFNLTNWSILSTRTGTGAWTGVQPSTASLAGGRIRFNFTTPGTPATQPRYFMRLIAEELP